MLTPYSAIPILYLSPAGKDPTTLVIKLPKAANAPTIIDFKNQPGFWMARCPAGTAATNIQVQCQLSGTAALVAADLHLPSAGTDVLAVAFDSYRADKEFLLDAMVEVVPVQSPSPKIYEQKPQWTQFAFQWDGADDSVLILRKVVIR